MENFDQISLDPLLTRAPIEAWIHHPPTAAKNTTPTTAATTATAPSAATPTP